TSPSTSSIASPCSSRGASSPRGARTRSGAIRRSRPSTSGPTTMLEVQDIHTNYGESYILQGLSLRVGQGQVVAVLGRNGVGKTTLIRSIIGFTPPRRGRILRRLKAGGASILIVEQNLAFALRIADYVYLMSKGRIVYESRPDELLRNPEVKARYLGV